HGNIPVPWSGLPAKLAFAAIGRDGDAALAGARSRYHAFKARELLEQLGIFGFQELPPQRLVRTCGPVLHQFGIEFEQDVGEIEFLVLEYDVDAPASGNLEHALEIVASLIGAAAPCRGVFVELF